MAGSSLRVDMAPKRLNETIMTGVWKELVPPAIITLTSPRCSLRVALPSEAIPVAQADMRGTIGPVMPQPQTGIGRRCANKHRGRKCGLDAPRAVVIQHLNLFFQDVQSAKRASSFQAPLARDPPA